MTNFWKQSYKKLLGIIVGVMLIVSVWWVYSHKNKPNSDAMPATIVKVSTVVAKEAADQFTTIGTIKALQGTDVSASVAGKIATIQFTSGQMINKGKVLFTLENDELASVVRQDQAKYSYDQAQYQRYFKLAPMGVVSKADLDLKKSMMAQNKAQLEHDKALLDKTIITAPFSGRLGVVQVSVGQYISEGQPIVTIQDDSTLYVDFYVPERISDLLQVGHNVVATSEQSGVHQWLGTIQALDPSMNSDNRTILVRAKMNTPYTNLVPGMYVNVSTSTSSLKPTLVIPQQAVVYNPYGDSVFVYHNGQVASRAITTGQRIGNDIIVMKGLQVGEQIVSAGQQKLFSGMTVQLAEEK